MENRKTDSAIKYYAKSEHSGGRFQMLITIKYLHIVVEHGEGYSAHRRAYPIMVIKHAVFVCSLLIVLLSVILEHLYK